MSTRLLAAALVAAGLALAQAKYTGPLPPKKDLPYLVHGNNLVPTDAAEAKQEDRKDEIAYIVAGEASTAKTPLASPVFVIDAAKIDAAKLQLFRLDVKSGHREIVFRKKGKSGSLPVPMSASIVSGSIFRLEVVRSLENGEYSLSPDGSNQVFCFTVY
jgi:hypothetical protein